MKGQNPILALDEKGPYLYVFLCGAIMSRFFVKLEKCRKYAFLGEYASLLQYYIGGRGLWGPQICIA